MPTWIQKEYSIRKKTLANKSNSQSWDVLTKIVIQWTPSSYLPLLGTSYYQMLLCHLGIEPSVSIFFFSRFSLVCKHLFIFKVVHD